MVAFFRNKRNNLLTSRNNTDLFHFVLQKFREKDFVKKPSPQPARLLDGPDLFPKVGLPGEDVREARSNWKSN
jgi:hypothetical protein